ncbi:hypothetical protein PoB_001516800 [Plakobranchus ocellatus]|uniref:Uncharacterized protein n=1 Tax=Plakobranchus ocellatus TaxID=259542 RepID=A0AAV3Z240_9GAST|nr:hypothetical protein PoB_001516800 [Plakobranchus ocellatus]
MRLASWLASNMATQLTTIHNISSALLALTHGASSKGPLASTNTQLGISSASTLHWITSYSTNIQSPSTTDSRQWTF